MDTPTTNTRTDPAPWALQVSILPSRSQGAGSLRGEDANMTDEILTGANPAGDARLLNALMGEDVIDPRSAAPLVANGPDSIGRIPTCGGCGQPRPTNAGPDRFADVASVLPSAEMMEVDNAVKSLVHADSVVDRGPIILRLIKLIGAERRAWLNRS